MTWGDVKLHKTASGEEYLEYNERHTKTRSGKTPEMCEKQLQRCFPYREVKEILLLCKLFAEKRPAKMNSDDSPFYLAVNSLKKLESLSYKAWFNLLTTAEG